jgi:hypothetical protein
MKDAAKLVGMLLVIGLVFAIGFYQWSDCLEENSFLTCARMLN